MVKRKYTKEGRYAKHFWYLLNRNFSMAAGGEFPSHQPVTYIKIIDEDERRINRQIPPLYHQSRPQF